MTSLPELIVGITSAIHRMPTLSMGDVFGSNIANVTLILGIVAILVRTIKSGTKTVQRNMSYASLVTLLPVLLLLDGHLTRADGVVLLVAFCLYNLILFYQRERFEKVFNHARRRKLVKNILLLCLGVALLLLSAEAITRLAQILALELAIPMVLIGLFFVAIGTSIPELIFSIKVSFAGDSHKEMILGGILGSLVANSTLILGVVAVICPIHIINPNLFLTTAGFMLASILLFWVFARSKKEITWQEGIGLLLFYFFFIAIEFWIKKG
jgi:cation:H+ antiporter